MGRAKEESLLMARIGSWRRRTGGSIVEVCRDEREEGLTKQDLSAIKSLLLNEV